MEKQRVSILGATGSIGLNTLKVIDLHRDQYQVYALSAHQNVELMVQLVKEYCPRYAVMADEQAAEQLQGLLVDSDTEVLSGISGLQQIAEAEEVDTVMAAIVGAAGLLPTLAAVHAGKKILFANKEALVMAGALFMRAAQESGATLLPIDSEHNAIFQCLPAELALKGVISDDLAPFGIEKILLTASGGPFLTRSIDDLHSVTPEDACKHPNWDMGRKISVDSATMMNKGLELIEACWLFNTSPSQIEVVIHPQSVIHSMVSYNDGSVLAQLGSPDMRTPIAYGLGWPERIASGVKALDLFEIAELNFQKPDPAQFPCLELAKWAADQRGHLPIILNAANEIAVAAFLNEKIAYTLISKVVESTMRSLDSIGGGGDIESILEIDATAREVARTFLDH